ncbi:YciI family protein [Pimelobacter simplex]|uniref:YciI family protein n=1 Tax=Nocardioides simplex TaxID=2045 RepID=UPI003AAF559D
MDFLVYHRDRPGSGDLRRALVEEHWSYMDGFAETMIARGPTFDESGEVLTGSVHVLGLPDPAAAWRFAFEEPSYQAGAYRDVLVRRFRNDLGRTMWDFAGGRDGDDRYLVIGWGPAPGPEPVVPDSDDLIGCGALLSDDGETWLGTAALVRAAGLDAAREVLAGHRYDAVEVHRWHFGGRRTEDQG